MSGRQTFASDQRASVKGRCRVVEEVNDAVPYLIRELFGTLPTAFPLWLVRKPARATVVCEGSNLPTVFQLGNRFTSVRCLWNESCWFAERQALGYCSRIKHLVLSVCYPGQLWGKTVTLVGFTGGTLMTRKVRKRTLVRLPFDSSVPYRVS